MGAGVYFKQSLDAISHPDVLGLTVEKRRESHDGFSWGEVNSGNGVQPKPSLMPWQE